MKMTNLLKIVFLFLIVFFHTKANGQHNFKEGYIIDLKSDTIKGEIKYRKWDIMPKRIEFRKGGEAVSVFYGPADIKGFSVSGNNYLGVIASLEKSSCKIHELDYKADFKLVVDTVFLEEIAGGSKPVYYHKDYKGKLNFFIASDTGIAPLLYKIYRQEDIDYGRQMTTVAKDERYKAHLYAYLQDCPAIGNSIRKMNYELRDFLRLLDEYHSCKKSDRN
mgnify:CR=1 FL=1